MKPISLTLEKQFKSLYIQCIHLSKQVYQQEFAILYDAHKSTNPEFPYWNYERFDLDEKTEDECMAEFRFYRENIYELLEQVQQKM